MNPNSLTIIVPALNEEKNIGVVCEDVNRIASQCLSNYEILVIDDASRDNTSGVVHKLGETNPRIRLVRNEKTAGLGGAYRTGLQNARCRYSMLIPGDNQIVAESLADIFSKVGETDVVVCYIRNQEVRPWWRHAISLIFTGSLNILFHMKLCYYNGTSVLDTELARKYVPVTSGYAYMAVMLVYFLKGGLTYQQMGFTLKERKYGRTKAFHIKNILSVLKNIGKLFWNVMILHRARPIILPEKPLSDDLGEPKHEKTPTLSGEDK